MLSDDSDSETNDNPLQLTINEHYAKAYAYKKEREELAKLKEKYGSDGEEIDNDDLDDSEEDESEDEDGEELTPAVDAAILRTLARIKKKDPAIYQADKGIFEEEQRKTKEKPVLSRAPKDKSKPLTIRQHALASALHLSPRSSPQPVTHVEEQRALRDETISAFHTAVAEGDEDADEDDGLLVLREKTKDELERQEEEYRAYLEREVAEDIATLVTVDEDTVGVRQTSVEVAEEQATKTKKRKNKGKEKEKKQETDQEFLMNYILNRGWIDRSARHVPTYSEVTHSHSKPDRAAEHSMEEDGIDGRGSEGDNDNLLLEDDDEFEDVAEQFETSYNFRFEEPDAAIIPAHPRNLPSLVRRQDTVRKEAREKRKARKEEELRKKKEEVRRLRALKMKDLRAKLERIGREGGKGIEDDTLAELDLDADWDPDAHDKQMFGIFGDDGEGDADFDTEKPHWDDDIDIDDIVPPTMSKTKKKKKKKKKMGGEEEPGADGVEVDAMDADVDPLPEDEEWDGTEEMRKRKLEEYMDEIYGMEFNDLVGDLPTRFHYTPVAPQSYALTPAEILLATDAELNQYMGVKKYAPYRKEGTWDKSRGERLKEFKEKLASRSGSGTFPNAGETGGERPAKKRKGKKERQKLKVATIATAYHSGVPAVDEGHSSEDRDGEIHASTGQKREAHNQESSGDGHPKKKRRRQKKAVE